MVQDRTTRIEVLGTFAVLVNGRLTDPTRWNLRRAQALVAMLALAPGQRVFRDHVVDTLWPSLDLVSGLHNLHQVLYRSRKALGADPADGWLTIVEQHVVLRSRPAEGVEVDALVFEAAARKAIASRSEQELRLALAEYSGDLLPRLMDTEWLADARESLRQLHISVLSALGECLQRRGSTEEAGKAFEAVLRVDPFREPAVRGILDALRRTGRQSEAISRYGEFRLALADTLGTDPDPQTQRLYEELLLGAPLGGIRPEPVPEVPTSFVGRDRELREIDSLMSLGRLTTLVGAGGSGKTRLGIEVARRCGSDNGPIGFIDLSGLTEPGLLADVVASGLGLIPGAGQDPSMALADQIGGSDLLVVLDNCEHLLGASAGLVTLLLAKCPHLRVLATSREPFRLPVEQTFRVPSLDLPPGDDGRTPDLVQLGAISSVRLFVDRAARVRPGFALSESNAAAIAELCRRLDGMPLAVELASARSALVEPAEMLERFDDLLSALARGPTGISRHETLRAALQWSFDLLAADERRLLGRLSVFAGGFSLPAAEAVCAGHGISTVDILDLLGLLVDKSLVNATHLGTSTRYRLLETVRQYSAEQLESSEGSDRTRTAHVSYFAEMAHRYDPEDASGVVLDDYSDLDREHDNLRASLIWSLSTDPPAALAMAGSLWRFWFFRCHVVEGSDWIERALAAAPAATRARAKALVGLTGLNARRGRSHLIRAASAEAVSIVESTMDPALLAVYRLVDATVVWATADVEDAESIARSVRSDVAGLERPELLAASSWVLAHCALTREDPDVAGQMLDRCLRELGDVGPGRPSFLPVVTPCSIVVRLGTWLVPTYEESLLVGRRVGAAQTVGFVLAAMGYAARLRSDLPGALAVVSSAIEQFRALGDGLGVAQGLNQLGCILRDCGDFGAAESRLEEARRLRRELGDRRGEWMTASNLAVLRALGGDIGLGRRLATQCLDAFRAVQDRPSIANGWAALGNVELVDGNLSGALHMYECAVTEFASQSWPRVEAWHQLVIADLSIRLGSNARALVALDRAGALLDRQRSAAALRRLTELRGLMT